MDVRRVLLFFSLSVFASTLTSMEGEKALGGFSACTY